MQRHDGNCFFVNALIRVNHLMECIQQPWQCIWDCDECGTKSFAAASDYYCDCCDHEETHDDDYCDDDDAHPNALLKPHHEDRIALPHLDWKHCLFCPLFPGKDSTQNWNDSCSAATKVLF